MYTIEKALEKANQLGKKAGENAAAWYEQDSWGGRSTGDCKKKAQAFLNAYDDGDPVLLDSVNLPNLSGEYAGDLTPASLMEAVGLDMEDTAEADCLVDDICQAWEDSCQEAFWDYLTASAHHVINE